PRYKKLDSWIVEKFKEKNKKVDKKSINLLEHMFNNKLDRLNSEIEKIVTCFPEKELINFKDIKKIISKDRLLKQNIIFDFVDALSKKEKGKAIKILNEMIEAGEIPLMILAMVTRQIRLLLSVKELKNQGNSSQKIADILNEHPYPIKKCYRFSDNFTVEELEILLERVLETNLDMVTGKYDNNKIALEMTLLEIK
ncbi:MAG: DNA polymerase III subunit delta, partial [Bacillota bacterium]